MNQQAGDHQPSVRSSSSTPQSNPDVPSPRASIWGLGIYLLLTSLVVIYLLIAIWPVQNASGDWELAVDLLFVTPFEIADDLRLLLIVVLSGAAGSSIAAQTSFATYVGNRSLVASWSWWYVLRPFIGMTLALVFYFVIRGGLLSVNSEADTISPYGVAAVAALVGLFSKQATDKLEEVFTTLFRTETGKGDDARGDKVADETFVSQHMIPLGKIKACSIPVGKTASDILLKDLAGILVPGITRIPVMTVNNVVTGVIHQSLLYKFIAEQSIDLQKQHQNFDFDSATLEQLLDFGGMRVLVTESLAFVALNATVSDAKRAMSQIEDCQDVFVTQTGSTKESLLGWLTNVDISRLTG